jgi:pimeloyl-ACP methyl ester carboxylesterase
MGENEVPKDVQAQPGQERRGWQGCLLGVGIVVGALSLFFCLLVGLSCAGGNRARAELATNHPPPGQMVDMGGYRLHIHCQGADKPGVPTVLLEAGAREFSLVWDRVQGRVAEFARVCAYDRAGLGWSDRGPNPRTVSHVTDELDALLAAAGVEPPYILVGHSMGGLYARYYAHKHPERVVGMVLVDSGHEEWSQRLPEALVKLGEQTNQILRILPVVSALGMAARDPDGYPSPFLPPLAPGTEETYKAVMAMSPYFFTTAVEEGDALEESYAAMRNLPDRSLGDLPLVVISAGKSEALPEGLISAEDQSLVRTIEAELQAELVTLSSNGRQMIAEDSGHHIQLEQPELVIEAIREMVEAARELN